MRGIALLAYNLIAGTAAHLLLMLMGEIAVMVLFGKIDEGLIHLIGGCVLPFFGAGALIASRELRWAKVVSILSGCIALVIPVAVIAGYNDWDWSAIGSKYVYSVIAVPFSLFGCLCAQRSRDRTLADH